MYTAGNTVDKTNTMRSNMICHLSNVSVQMSSAKSHPLNVMSSMSTVTNQESRVRISPWRWRLRLIQRLTIAKKVRDKNRYL